MSQQFTPKQVAQALRVSESSVKRWCDSGKIDSIRTVGGHRRIMFASLMSFLEESDRQLLDPHILGLDPPTSIAKEAVTEQKSIDRGLEDRLVASFEKSVLSGDETEAKRAVGQWYAMHQEFSALADRLIGDTFYKMGELWQCDQIEIYQERRACEICTRILNEMRRLVPQPLSSSPLAMGGAPEKDQYTLPSQLIEVVLRECQWNTTNLGANLPFRTMLAAIREHQPKLFWLSVSSIHNKPKFIQEFNSFADAMPKEISLVVGGRALSDDVRTELRFTSYCDNMQQLGRFAKAVRGFRPHLGESDN